jgi:hypothetical protein
LLIKFGIITFILRSYQDKPKSLNKMPRLIYDYTKSMLENVSFNPELFKKELKKGIKNLLPSEIEQLNNWLVYFTNNKPELKNCLTELNLNKGVC